MNEQVRDHDAVVVPLAPGEALLATRPTKTPLWVRAKAKAGSKLIDLLDGESNVLVREQVLPPQPAIPPLGDFPGLPASEGMTHKSDSPFVPDRTMFYGFHVQAFVTSQADAETVRRLWNGRFRFFFGATVGIDLPAVLLRDRYDITVTEKPIGIGPFESIAATIELPEPLEIDVDVLFVLHGILVKPFALHGILAAPA